MLITATWKRGKGNRGTGREGCSTPPKKVPSETIAFLILTVSYARWPIWMTINQGNGMSKEAGVISKVLSLEGFAICQINSYLKRLMWFQVTYVSHLFHRSQGGWASRHLMKAEVIQTGGSTFWRVRANSKRGHLKDSIWGNEWEGKTTSELKALNITRYHGTGATGAAHPWPATGHGSTVQ